MSTPQSAIADAARLQEVMGKIFRNGYAAFLVEDWIPALDGVKDKLVRRAAVADVGCGRGASTILMSKASSNSRFTGFDFLRGGRDRAQPQASRPRRWSARLAR